MNELSFHNRILVGAMALILPAIASAKDLGYEFRTAAMNGHLDVVKILLEHEADPNAVTEKGASALAVARQKGHDKIAELLERAGATR